jgi:AAA family ATP:ADP antiporter
MTATRLTRLLSSTLDIQPREIRATLASFLLVLMLMAAYYILRPLRDAMASNWTDAEVSWLWTLTFLFSIAAVTLYGAAVARLKARLLVPLIYGVFAASFALFYLAGQVWGPSVWLDKSFYVWVSVFSLFHISVFWVLMADTFSRYQATRLFGFIGAGASVGGIVGPALAALLVDDMGTRALLLLASVLVVLSLPIIRVLQGLKATELPDPENHLAGAQADAIGGNPLEGFRAFCKSPFLLGIGLFIFLYTAISSFVYFELKNLLVVYDLETRARIWASMDLVVNVMTILVAVFATGRIASRLGLPFTLASVPVLICGGMLILAATPMVAVVVTVQVVRRVGNYAISRPAREMLFTAVDRETRFKAKPVIDIVIYRGGDMLNAWLFTALTQGLGLGLAGAAAVGAGIAGAWAVTGIYLGRVFDRRKQVGKG